MKKLGRPPEANRKPRRIPQNLSLSLAGRSLLEKLAERSGRNFSDVVVCGLLASAMKDDNDAFYSLTPQEQSDLLPYFQLYANPQG